MPNELASLLYYLTLGLAILFSLGAFLAGVALMIRWGWSFYEWLESR